GSRYRVGPDSAGADPGPACYRRGGPLTVTDCNVMLGKLQAEFFPSVFGPNADETLDSAIVREKFEALAQEIQEATGDQRSAVEVAAGFLRIAVDNMANAIKQISVQRGHDVTRYTLNCFGGAGGKHACLVADALGRKTVLIHPHGGVLSAYGMGLANMSAHREMPVDARLDEALLERIRTELAALGEKAVAELIAQGCAREDMHQRPQVHLKYEGTDTALEIDLADIDSMRAQFERDHKRQFGFLMPN